jgi:hypothetical protein
MTRDAVETRHDRTALAADAGLGRISFGSVLAGTLVAYGAFAVLVAIAAAVMKGGGFDADLSADEWRDLGVGGGIALGLVVFLAYFYGGYVAGRMARRSGAMNGLMVFFMGIVVAVGVAGVANLFTDTEDIVANLRRVGVPTTLEEWGDVGTVAGIASLAAMLLGSLIGGMKGERWHGKLAAKAAEHQSAIVEDGTPVMATRRDADVDRTDTTATTKTADTSTTLDEDYARETSSSRSSDQ